MASTKAAATGKGKSSKGASSPPSRPAKKSAVKAPAPAANPAIAGETPSELVDAQLSRYRSMRDFGVTAEPSGDPPKTPPRKAAKAAKPTKGTAERGLPFVIQKHAASHLHYDFRLGWSGVLKSWAVAKGPSYTTSDRRLAVQVEDHPVEYGGFEGIIPKGQYGGGTVMVWDQGTWWPQPGHENVDAGLREGSLKFELNGTKLRGKWTLVRMHTTKPAPGGNGRWKSSDKPQWLLIKEHDAFERPASAPAITEEAPDSALTGRTMEQIAAQSDHVWNSKETATPGAQAWYRQEPAEAPPAEAAPPASAAKPAAGDPKRLTIAPRPRKPSGSARAVAGSASTAPDAATADPLHELRDRIDDLPAEPQPEFVRPQLAQETETPPDGPDWVHELKLDGYRMQARKSARGVQMLTRSGLDWTYRVQAIADAVEKLPVGSVTLDGEVVVLAENGTTNFADLQASFQEGAKHPLTFFCFDLLHLEGRNPRELSLRERKQLLAAVVPASDTAPVRLSEHLDTGGKALFEQACKLHAEGLVSKRGDAPYRAGRTADWLKAKCLHEQEFVVAGFGESSDGPDRIGSLLLGYYRDKKLIYAGRAGTGYTQRMRRELRTRLGELQVKSPAFSSVPAEARRGVTWVKPVLVAQVRFASWTAEDLVRQAAFLGLREDKAPEEVVREDAAAPPQPKASRNAAASATAATPAPPATAPRKAAGRPAKTASPPPSAPPIRLTHPTRVLDPESRVSKQQLADFYWAVAERMLPHIADRPLSLVRCPDGAGKPCFYQKHVNHMLPEGVGSVMVADKKGGAPEPYITLNTPQALAGLAQMAVLEVHPWGSRNDLLECPDRLIFDLDPDEELPWSTVAEAAREVRDRLKTAKLESFLKTTGGKGLHIVAPILPEHDFATVKDAAHRFVMGMERANPRLYLTKMTKAARKGKIYLDYLRNERGATAVAPFSPRARPGVPISVTLDWKELEIPERPRFSIADFADWRGRLKRDPWQRIFRVAQSMDPKRLAAG